MGKAFEKSIRMAAGVFVVAAALTVSAFGQQPKVKPVGRVVVVDSKGKIVATNLGGMGIPGAHNDVRPTVLLEVDGLVVPVNVARDQFFAGAILNFEGENCTGKAWYPAESGQLVLFPRAVIAPPGQTLYVDRLGSAPQSITIRSRFINGHINRGECVNFTQTFPTEVPMQPLVDLLTVFTPPFSVRAAQ